VNSEQLKAAIAPPSRVGLGAPARVDRRTVDGKEVVVLLIRAGESARETALILRDARTRFAHLEPHIHHIELEMVPSTYAQIMRAQKKRARKFR